MAWSRAASTRPPKAGLLELIDEATAASWEHRRACGYLELAEGGAWHWWKRREATRLDDRPAGGPPVHGQGAAFSAP